MTKMNRRGQGMTEYIVILGIIVAAAVLLFPKIKAALETKVGTVTTDIAKP